MRNKSAENFFIPATANYVTQGEGTPVVMIHGLAASLHDWDDLIPVLTQNGYTSHALDLLGHGESPKPSSRGYQVDWMLDHFSQWIRSLQLTEPAIVIGHSLGGYVALEYARRAAFWTRGLILVDPFYSRSQLPLLLRNAYGHSNLSGLIASRTPEWMFRIIVDVTSAALGHSAGGVHSLPEHVRAQTALDFTRTAPGVYNLPNVTADLTPYLQQIDMPTLVVWGDRDQTLAPSSFPKLVKALPRAEGKSVRGAGHVPHQSNADEFNQDVLKFIRGLG